ncbi:hypothetical protein K7B10_16305 [Streptomyces flavotricini]|uniref:Lipoprotein n=1 Tax=Streptomyces flavotricini TaxID=66888 RepID=A0ABS8E6Z8_9ACTN|nr:hypothetical protein [Streptomyces flavotricini]MCC0096322.1 hypothetical protein [Streptomyces flavotricini]
MHIRVRPQTAAVIALAASAALALAGCSSSDGSGAAGAPKPAAASQSAKPSPKATGAPLGRDAVDDEVKSSLRAAGLDPEKGKGSGDANATKNASVVDWTAVTTTQQAEWALPRLGEQLKHLGWRETAPQSYEKTDWVLLIGSTKQSNTVNLKSTESLLTVNVTYLGAG